MASDPDHDELARFLRKALDIQVSDPDEILTEGELAKIARNAGLSEDDWKRVCSDLEKHLQKGRNFLAFDNFEDAVTELEQAVSLAPYRAGVLCDCGKAHLMNWRERNVKASRGRSEELLLKTLQIDPGNVEAAELLSVLRKPEPAIPGWAKSTAIGATAAALVIAAWAGLTSPQVESSGEVAEAIEIESRIAENPVHIARNWLWGSGGELVLEADGTARHTEWKREGGWSVYPDGSVFLEAPTGTFRIEFEEGVGQVRHLQRGGSTTIVPKI